VISQSIGVSYPGIQTEKLMSIKVLLPPTNEQSQIVSFLDTKTQKIDELIEKTEQKIELLKEKRTSLINHCVTKGLNPNVEMKDSGVEWIGEIPSHWIRTKMKYVVHIFGRIGYRGYTTEDIVNEGEGVITISPSNIREDKFSTENSTYLSWEKYHESPEIQIFTNDIILVKTGSTIGKTSIIPNNVPEMTINPQLVVLKNIRLFPKYLYYQTTCRFIKESFDIEQTGSSTPTISQEKMNEFPILNPSNDEQIQIVEYLDEQTQKIDSTIEKETQRIELLKEYRQSLISEVVTGKVDVRDYNG
jgi:type I restriction enzyme S subunit